MKTERIDNVFEVTTRLLGEIEPQGETRTDDVRLENLKHRIDVTDALIESIIVIARHKNRHEYSMSRAGRMADDFIERLRVTLL